MIKHSNECVEDIGNCVLLAFRHIVKFLNTKSAGIAIVVLCFWYISHVNIKHGLLSIRRGLLQWCFRLSYILWRYHLVSMIYMPLHKFQRDNWTEQGCFRYFMMILFYFLLAAEFSNAWLNACYICPLEDCLYAVRISCDWLKLVI